MVAALVLLPSAVAAQQHARPLVLAGRLARVRGADTTSLAGARVVAHRVGRARQGPIDSSRTDARGGFRFVVAAPESGAVYVVSTLHDGIGYFSEPVAPGPSGAGSMQLLVFDTSTAGPPLEIGMRNIVVTRGPGGAHRVLDIFQVENSGATARVGADSLAPVFTARLPAGVTDPQPGASDIPASAIRFASGQALVSAPFPPGDKQVVFSYTLPAGARTLEVPVDRATAQVELLLEDSTAQPSGALRPADPVSIEGHTFRRYSAGGLPAGTSFSVRFDESRGSSRRAVLFAALAAGAFLATGAVLALRRHPASSTAEPEAAGSATSSDAAPAADSRERLVAQLAALDERFEGREGETPPAAWVSYQQRRATLKAALARRLAQG